MLFAYLHPWPRHLHSRISLTAALKRGVQVHLFSPPYGAGGRSGLEDRGKHWKYFSPLRFGTQSFSTPVFPPCLLSDPSEHKTARVFCWGVRCGCSTVGRLQESALSHLPLYQVCSMGDNEERKWKLSVVLSCCLHHHSKWWRFNSFILG